MLRNARAAGHLDIGGISAVEPSYKRSRIALYPRGRLLRGSGSLHTVNRLLSSRWTDRDSTCARKVTVPVTSASKSISLERIRSAA